MMELNPNGHDDSDGKVRLQEAIAAAFDKSAPNGNRLGGVINLSTGHAAKGLEWRTVYIVEPSNMMLRNVIARGGLAAEDETHVRHVMISRARHRLLYLRDAFFNKAGGGIAGLFDVQR